MDCPTGAKLIPLTQGQFAIVDEADFEWLSQWKWYAHWDACAKTFYARRSAGNGRSRTTMDMHRLILGLARGDKRRADHVCNGETLDNRRSNLRIATLAQNQMNRRLQGNNKSGMKGVSWFKKLRKWRAEIQSNGKHLHLGCYLLPEVAHAAYCAAALRLHGPLANFGN